MEWRKAVGITLALLLLAGCRLNVNVDGEGTVTSDNNKIDCPGDCKAKLKRGKEITLTANAAAGSFFAGWRGCDSEDSTTCVVVGKNKNRKVTAVFSPDSTLADADLAEDLKLCALDTGFKETDTLAAIDRLVCDGDEVDYGGEFDTNGLSQLANLNSLEISNVELDSLEGIATLDNLQTLRLIDVGLSDITPLLELNPETLTSVDLQGNAQLDCDDLEQLENAFPDTSISAQQCENNGSN